MTEEEIYAVAVPARKHRRGEGQQIPSSCSSPSPGQGRCGGGGPSSSPHFPRSAAALLSRCGAAMDGADRSSPHFPPCVPSPASRSIATLGTLTDSLGGGGLGGVAASHFLGCPTFAGRYRAAGGSGGLDRSLRHLCPFGCYLWAFAPAREWHGLREAVRAATGCPPDRILRGWSCRLIAEEGGDGGQARPQRTSVRFPSPDGATRCRNAVEVLRQLGLNGRVGDGRLRVRKSRVSGTSKRSAMSWNRPTEAMTGARLVTPALRTEVAAWGGASVASPFGLLEELFADDPWRLLLSTIFLNRTTRRQVDRTLHDFLLRWPDAESAAAADPADVLEIVSPLGIKYRRSRGIVRFSAEYVALVRSKASRHFPANEGGGGSDCGDGSLLSSISAAFDLDDEDVAGLYGCGKYALSVYRVFIRKDLGAEVQDHALRYYVDYQRDVQR